jgi:hypothetical protein
MKLRNLAAVLGLAGGGLLAGQAQAVFIIDDFNVDNASVCSGNTQVGCGVDTDMTGRAAGKTRRARC